MRRISGRARVADGHSILLAEEIGHIRPLVADLAERCFQRRQVNIPLAKEQMLVNAAFHILQVQMSDRRAELSHRGGEIRVGEKSVADIQVDLSRGDPTAWIIASMS